ncbi:MAG TPA: secretin N-terminal domain-containing protein [Thermoanaerobaculia bacterium]
MVRRSIASFLGLLALASMLSAQPQAEVVVRAYTFQHQRASEALALVYPLLSPRGAVELQPAGNTLVVRDVQAAINRIMPVLKSFDHPARPLRLEIYVVRASKSVVSPQVQRSDLPEVLTQRLRDLLGYHVFEKQAQAQLAGVEGQSVVYELGAEYKVSFRFGTLQEGQRTKLVNFRIARRGENKVENTLLHAHLNLWLDQPLSLGLAKNEDSREALMLVLTLREGDSPRRN